MDVDEVLRQTLQRAEIRQLLLGARAEKQHQLAALELARGTQTTAPLGHRTHRCAAGAGTNHHDVRARVVRHQEAGAKWAYDLNRITDLQVAHVVGTDTAHWIALTVLQHPLDRERQVVVAGTFAVARAGDGILARMVRTTACIDTGRNDANRLSLQYRERHCCKIEHDVVGVVFATDVGHAHVSGNCRGDELLRRLRAVEIGVSVGGRPRWQGRTVQRAVEHRFSVLRGCPDRRHRRHRLHVGCGIDGHSFQSQLLGGQLGGQFIPLQLFFQRIGLRPGHDAPVVDRPGRARRDAGHAEVALVRVDYVVAVIVRDRLDRARSLTGVAAYADLGVDQVLLDNLDGSCIHGGLLWSQLGSLSAPALPLRVRPPRGARKLGAARRFLVRMRRAGPNRALATSWVS